MSRYKEYDDELTRLRTSFGEGVFVHQEEPLFNRSNVMVIGKCTNPAQWGAEAQSICDKMLITYETKDSDYAADGKPMGNLRMSEEVGVPAWKGVLIRMGDKRRRIESFALRGTYAVETEKLDDTMIDLSNYCLLGLLLFAEAHEKCDERVAEVQAAYRRVAHLAIYLTVLFRKGVNDPDILPWNTSKEWSELLQRYGEIARYARDS